ncbi:ribonuclease Z [Salinithrix halophila]|uniref:Ribonuclease Z n=1 Tax=Salinithrix halophila TaxID=1485204 RepID=A0ABV8JLK5_9BACL
MELIFLGTGAGIPSRERNVSSVALRLTASKGTTWLFDCGEGTQHRILDSPVRLSKVERIFITHLHGDHIFGLPGVLGSRSFQGVTSPLTLYGPEGLGDFVEAALAASRTFLRYPLEFVKVEEGTVFECKGFRVIVGELEHGIPSFGYRIEEPDYPGELLVEALRREGVSPGPHFATLKKEGNITLSDGRILQGRDYLGPSLPGRKLALFGDTRPTSRGVELARDTDLLVHEATYAAGREDLAREHFHSTAIQAAETARDAGVKRLILTHVSTRYSKEEAQELVQQARRIFPKTVMAYDQAVFSVERQ